MFYTIYKITNKLNGKFYIGKHQTRILDDGYMGSGKALRTAIKFHGKENFTKEILFIFETEQEMNSKEKEILTEEFIKIEHNYNSAVGGEGGPHFRGRKHSPETKQKIRNFRTSRKISDETKKKISEKAKLRTQTGNNVLMNFSGNRKGKKCSEEHKLRISESLKRRAGQGR